jgi:hypothetical protein
MTNATNRRNIPAAVTRTGPWAAALPRKDEALDQLIADPRLSSTDKTILLALVRNWAWAKDHCWPSDKTIAAKVGRSPGHIQRRLHHLERAGYIERQHTDEVPNGRRIWLLWRRQADAGAHPVTAVAREVPPAPARTEEVVSSKSGIETEGKSARPTMTTNDDSAGPQDEPGTARTVGMGGRPATVPPFRDLPQTSLRTDRLKLLGREELASVATRTGDPILVGELLRVSAPPPPPEPSPWGRPASELVAKLPGRHDLVIPAARALCAAVGDAKGATFRACQAMARAVASREVSAEVLSDCVGQATGPRARHAGKVLVASWRRSVRTSPV